MRNPLQMMEPTFYEDVGAMYGGNPGMDCNMDGQLKQRSGLTLDLNGGLNHLGGGPGHHQRYNNNGLMTNSNLASCHKLASNKMQQVPLLPCNLNSLNSPDFLKLNSPEFEKLMLTQQDGLIMPPNSSQIYFGGIKGLHQVTEEQEEFTKGFENALNELHHSDSSQESGSCNGGLGATYTQLEPPGSVHSTESLFGTGLLHIKDEPQTVPSVSSSPPMSPIDMETQEKIKLERKRQRNRVAASKCRKRKLERISRLEDRVRVLKGENNELNQAVSRLKEHVCRLKEQVMDHVHSGCQIMTTGPHGAMAF